MRVASSIVLCAVFCSAFIGRTAVLAAALAEKESPPSAQREDDAGKLCIGGPLAEEMTRELDWIEKQKAKLDDKRSELTAIGVHLERRASELESLNNALAAKLTEVEASRREKQSEVGAIYAQMKPAAASGIIAGMDPEFAAGLLLAMNEENASAILATLPADRAYAITVLMARQLSN